MDMKIKTGIEELCLGLPEEFVQYMNYCRNLKFEDRPDYAFLRKLFKDLFYKMGYEYDYVFDWMLQKKVSVPFIVFRYNR